MQRVRRSTAVAILPAAPTGGTPGFFANPNPAGGVPATAPGYEWYNGVQEELMAVIEGQGLSGSDSDHTKLRQAITKMLQAAQRAVAFNNVTFAGAVTGTGKAVYWDSANSRFDLALADGTAKQNCVGFADVPNSTIYAFGDAVLFAGLTPGRYYLDATTAGAITASAPAANALFVGIAKSATELFIDIDAQPLAASTCVQGAFKNLQASATGLSANVSVTADEIIVENAANAYQTLRAVNLTIAGTASGAANGLDTGALAASTWYAIWVIWNGATTAGLLSLSATAPTLPAGYTHKARVGWIRTDSSGNKYPLSFVQFGRRVQYKVAAGSNLTAYPQMANATSTTAQAAVATGNYIPPTAGAIDVQITATSSGTGTTTAVYANALPASAIASVWDTSAVGVQSARATIALESTNIYWSTAVVSGSGSVNCIGWEDNL